MPSWRANEFGVRAYPTALLQKPQFLYPNPPFPWTGDRFQYGAGHAGEEGTERGPEVVSAPNRTRLDMSVLFIGGERIHKKVVYQNMCLTRLKTALGLVVIRGAVAEDPAAGRRGRMRLVFKDTERISAREWVLQGAQGNQYVPLPSV
jgi:hypothetical protein